MRLSGKRRSLKAATYMGEWKKPHTVPVHMHIREDLSLRLKLIPGAEHVKLISEELLQHSAGKTGKGGCFF